MSAPIPGVRLRARRDAIVAVVTAIGVCGALATISGGHALIGVAGGVVGLALATTAAVSILCRTPVFTTPADRVTLVRAVLVSGCATVVVLSLLGDAPMRSWPLVLLAAPALLLDAVDGFVARRTDTVSEQGARFDMEVDAALLMVLSVPAAVAVGPWVLGIGVMRYAFAAASWWRPALRQRLNFSSFRRIVAGIQGVVLVVALAPAVPLPVAMLATAVALALLAVSFGRDVITLERAYVAGPESVSGAPAAPVDEHVGARATPEGGSRG